MSQTANNYGQALYDLAKEEGLDAVILQQLEVLQESFAREPEFLRLLNTPNLTKQERCGVLEESFRGRVEPYLLNFMKLLTGKGHIRQFPECCRVYRRSYNADHGILCVKVHSVAALTDQQKQKLTRKLESLTGNTVELDVHTDPELLGGIRLDYEGVQVDGTVKSRLDAVGKLLKNTVL